MFQTKHTYKMSNLDLICQLETNWPIFRGLIWKAAFRFGPMFAWPFTVTKWNSCEGFLIQPTYLSDKRKQQNMKFVAFSATRNKLANFFFWRGGGGGGGGGWFGRQHSVLTQTFQSPSVSLNKTPVKVFGWSHLPLRQKKATKYEIWTLFGTSKQIDQFLEGWFGKQHSVFAQTFQSSSVSLNKTPVKVFGWSHLPFRQKKATKYEIWTLFTCSKQTGQFWGAWFGKQHSVLAQAFQSSLVSLNKTPVKLFGWSHLPVRQKKQSNMKFWSFPAAWNKLTNF